MVVAKSIEEAFRPAWVRVGAQVLSGREYARLVDAISEVTEALGSGLDRPMQAAWDAAPSASLSAAFSITLRVGEIGPHDQVVVDLDDAAARALVDCAEEELAELRGHGALSEAECGLLEYVVLRCVDDLSRSGVPISVVRLAARTDGPSDVSADLRPATLRVVIGGREGRATLWLPPSPGSRRDDEDAWDAASPPMPRDRIDVSWRVPLAMDEGELARADAGDVLLLGARELASLPAPGALVASTGWKLTHATARADTALSTRLVCGLPDPTPHVAAAYVDGRVALEVVLAEGVILRSALEEWEDGHVLELARPRCGVRILHRGRPVGRGELARHEGEVVVRLLEFDASAIGER